MCIPGFERKNAPPVPVVEEGEEAGEEIDRPPVYEADYNYEEMEWKTMPDFVDRVRVNRDFFFCNPL